MKQPNLIIEEFFEGIPKSDPAAEAEELSLISNMKSKVFLFLTIIILMGCQSGKRKSGQTGELPVIDISKNYPKKEIRLQDIADMEYIPLETTDDVLLGRYSFISYVSDKYILVWEMMQGDVFVFNRNGKIVSHFNRKGQGGQEYTSISGSGVLFDEKKAEIFVIDDPTKRILVYSVNGEYKRTLKYSTDLNIMMAGSVCNFDDETLLIYDMYKPYLGDNKSEKPYLLMSKIDGSIVSVLDINLPVRYSNRIYQEIDLGGGQKVKTASTISTPNNKYYGQDLVIADISSDTIYQLTQNRDLTPMLVRTPSVHSSEPRVVWTTLLTTGKFIVLQKTTLDFIAAEKGRESPPVTLMYEFETGETSEVSFINAEFAMGKWIPNAMNAPNISRNMMADLMWPSRLKEAYENKQLKGALEKIAEALDEEDNPIVRIIKFK